MEKTQVTEKRKPIGIRLDNNLLDLLEAISQQPGTVWTGMSRTSLIEYAIKYTFANDGANE